MSKEKLQSEQLVSELDSDLNATQNKWKTIRKDLDNKDRWNDFQSRYNKIKKDFKGNTAQKLAALKDAKALRKDIQLEISKIQQARDQFNEDNKRISRKFKAAKNGPRDDIKRIKEKYNLNNLDTQNITQLIFGEKISEYIHLAEKWYNRIKPYIEESPEEIAEREARKRKQGQNIKFPEYNPKPDFYVRKASIDATIPRGRFIGTIRDISSDQSVNKQPMTLELKGVDMRHRKSESINAEFNYINKNKGYSLFNYDIQALELNEHQISKSNKLPLTMQKGLMSLRLNSRLENKEIKGTGNINFSKVNFTSNNSDKSSFTKMMISSFSNITNFNINTRFSGSFSNLNLRLDSDLDNKLGAQLKNQLKQRGQQFENQLKAKIDQRLKEPMTRLENRKKQLAQIKSSIDSKEKELKQKLADIENRIKNAGKEKTDKKKEELLNKLKSKFKL